jgi:hypothetical protein
LRYFVSKERGKLKINKEEKKEGRGSINKKKNKGNKQEEKVQSKTLYTINGAKKLWLIN